MPVKKLTKISNTVYRATVSVDTAFCFVTNGSVSLCILLCTVVKKNCVCSMSLSVCVCVCVYYQSVMVRP